VAVKDVGTNWNRDTRNIIDENDKNLQRQINDLVLGSGDSNAEVAQARGGEPTLNDRLDKQDSKVNSNQEAINSLTLNKAEKLEVENLKDTLENLGSIKPQGVYSTLNNLENAFPEGASGIYIVLADNNWYFWSNLNSEWTSGGVYQAELVDGSVTSSKRTYLGERGYVDGAEPVFVDMNEKKIYYSPANIVHRVYYRNQRNEIPTQTVDIPSGSSRYAIWFSVDTGVITVVDHMSSLPVKEDFILLGWVNTGLIYEQKHTDLYGNYEIVGDLSKHYDLGIVMGATVDFDFNNKQMIIDSSSATRLIYKGYYYDLPRVPIDFSNVTGSYLKVLLNVKTRTIEFKPHNEPYSNMYVLLAVIRNVEPYQVWMNGDYTINGEPPYASTEYVQTYINDNIDNFISDANDLKLLRYNLEDTINSWWVYPLAKRYIGYRDKTYLGYTDSQGFSGVASIDNDTGQIVKKRLKKADIDDHNAPCVDVMPNGRIISAYSSGHNIDNKMYVQISSKIESVEEFDEPTVIEANGTTTYSQLFHKSNKWWLFFRVGNVDWAYSTSVDGKTWSTPTTLIKGGMQYYVKFVEVTDSPNLLRLVMYSNPNHADLNIRLGFLDTSTGELKLDDDTILGTENVSKDDFPIIVPVESGKKQRLLDVAVTNKTTTLIAYGVFTDKDDGFYKFAKYENGTLNTSDLTATGEAFYHYSVYLGGAVFDNENNLYLSINNDINWTIEKWSTIDNLNYSFSETIKTITNGVGIRPVLEVNGDKLFWQEGYFNPANFKDFNTDLKFASI